MKYWSALAVFAFGLQADPRAPLGIVRANLSHWEGSWEGGSLHLKLDSGADYACQFDGRTFFDRERARIQISRLKSGDRLELVTDRTTVQQKRCYARMVRVLPPGTPEGFTWGSITRATEHFAPRGMIEYSGVILASDAKWLVIRTRAADRHEIRMRPDTKIMLAGYPAQASALDVNQRVFVRAGLNAEEELEAYQIIGGDILQPKAGEARPTAVKP